MPTTESTSGRCDGLPRSQSAATQCTAVRPPPTLPARRTQPAADHRQTTHERGQRTEEHGKGQEGETGTRRRSGADRTMGRRRKWRRTAAVDESCHDEKNDRRRCQSNKSRLEAEKDNARTSRRWMSEVEKEDEGEVAAADQCGAVS